MRSLDCEELCENYLRVVADIDRICHEIQRLPDSVKLIVVSKFQSAEKIRCLLELGQRDFGENRIEEIKIKWPALINEYPNVRLHFIGPIQSKKIADIVRCTQVIHSVDRLKVVEEINRQSGFQHKKTECLIQVNIGREVQKSGIELAEFAEFLSFCRSQPDLRVLGAMCIPPVNDDPQPYFKTMQDLQIRYNLAELSMGMSSDYLAAIALGSTMVRVGSKIFGPR